MAKKIAILQSNYIPWKGYFDIIGMVDLFIFHDDLQYTKNDWRNRNKIKVPNGTQWLTVPCGTNEKRLICDVHLSDNSWQKKHWRKIFQNYKNAPFFEDIYLSHKWDNLSDFNQYVIKKISTDFFDFKTQFEDSRKYNLSQRKGERVIELLKKSEADVYLSGPSAKNYINPDMFEEAGIKLSWMDYSGYSEYNQLFPPFIHEVSILDLIFNEGPNAPNYMKSF